MNQMNFQKEFEKEVISLSNRADKPRLLLHSCCAPCSSYCLVYLREWFDITCLYYNPNITDKFEYEKRIQELSRLISSLAEDPVCITSVDNQIVLGMGISDNLKSYGSIDMISGAYEPELFLENVRRGSLESAVEGGERCKMCFDLRLREAARIAVEGHYDYFTTTLTISPLKNAALLNQIGYDIADQYDGIKWLPSDFKKKNGYKISTQLCERYDLYRQNYCGCVYSKR